MSAREIVFDTETTGLSWQDGHRIIEIGAVELNRRLPTGKTFQRYIDPEREIEQSAIRVHGITNESLQGMPKFKDIIDEFLEFIGDAPLVAHNARFDVDFINAELDWADVDPLENDIVDTLEIARRKYPGARASLDALCQRYEIDLSGRKFHGALLDAHLLADVYMELTGGLQPDMMNVLDENSDTAGVSAIKHIKKDRREPRTFPVNEKELAAHAEFIAQIENALWSKDDHGG